ncbi:hypothetical protein DSW25_02460 [Sulfitobacter donghicola DSW-25 = KCTC 12864 = JCM 14565]|uniref:Uncharacterized protein n=1 Tax=Sulfitobacter donghicola DSW-25 = KCTC 12864 = JCM 14565 TaxID=1300350 RepID=A0A073J0A1_9RHOB|nr:hypothetical protein DSW25_02460 [Sulfitobacter donghicola DSW-25 = KCTC 12864 = JCM 14565]
MNASLLRDRLQVQVLPESPFLTVCLANFQNCERFERRKTWLRELSKTVQIPDRM